MLARLEREGSVDRSARRRAVRSLRAQPWVDFQLEPDRGVVAELAARHRLRGADLWHLATAATLAPELPGLTILTFDERLANAANAEGLAV